ncbi:ParB-like nuclease domain-containing protein [Klebsiella quasipneumoniae]|nr:ParB-like nuclease domain-containing protein [Klebsiella quasipneumoniae]EIY4985684.1 ParB-like nuclease domain-containing protein [Klebsiella quasipneumoniae]EIY5121724.1 ParB-like nuclease domain-containing protein [Klebsiella quasipneumoniae]EIY5122304.1 ParB-like nuclease domain-containing protein [Klebsiella quasipneumoniae]EIY5465927.1 ParB-like nuclease domain-containing protein [Klebsiella quasipneumoniae]
MGDHVMKPEIANIIIEYINAQDNLHEKISVINGMKSLLHQHSPFSHEPVDCVLWVRQETVEANDYNPNVMATAEKKLLERSIEMDGFTQPIVTAWHDNRHLVVDGFHRHLTGKSSPNLKARLHGYLPITHVSTTRQGQRERIAATIRHNRARGKHQINALCDIVRDLYRLGWSDQQIGMELGMSADEVLRLKQINGLADLFADEEYSQAWTVE